jgi:hypothetical protein
MKSKLKLNKKSKLKLNKKSKLKLKNMKGGALDGDGNIEYINPDLVYGTNTMDYTQNKKEASKPTYFYFERLTIDKLIFWRNFIAEQKKQTRGIINNRNENKKKVISTIDGYTSFEESLNLYNNNRSIDYIWIAYSSLKKLEEKDQMLNYDIEMVVSVFFQPDIPITFHRGITRNHLFFQSEYPSTKNLSIYLHSFAAKSVLTICEQIKVDSPKYMITRPAIVMGNIILKKFASLDESFKENNPGFNTNTNKNYYSSSKIKNIWVCDEKDRTEAYNEGMCIPKESNDSEDVFPLKFLQQYSENKNDLYSKLQTKNIQQQENETLEYFSRKKKYQSQLKSEQNEAEKIKIAQQIRQCQLDITKCSKRVSKLMESYTLLPKWEFQYKGETYSFDIPHWFDINPDKPTQTFHSQFLYTPLPNIIMDLNALASIF